MTNFEEMMGKMMEQYMAKAMEQYMTKMFSSMMGEPEVAKAEVIAEPKKAPKTLSKEDFLALTEKVDEPVAPIELDFEVFGKTAKYNRSVPSDIWTINHIKITNNYGAKWSKKNGGYVFNSTAELRNFLTSYCIITELTDDDKKAVEQYKKDRAARQAEYYAKLAK